MILPVLTGKRDAFDGTATEFGTTHGLPIYIKSIKDPPLEAPKSTGLRVLKSATTNNKIGGKSNRITKGPKVFRGKSLYSLTLAERATCPMDCKQWDNCYGNNMPFAHRYLPNVDLEHSIWLDLQELNRKHPEGFAIRLHILGDFYSVGYVNFWRKKLVEFPNMVIYGYTHRKAGTRIGDAVAKMATDFGDRVSILRSDGEGADRLPFAITVKRGQTPDPSIVVCPEQTERVNSCLECGLCFNSRTSVQFLEH